MLLILFIALLLQLIELSLQRLYLIQPIIKAP